MSSLRAVRAVFAFIACIAFAWLATPCVASASLVITNVDVVNVRLGDIQRGRTITIEDGRIASVTASPPPAGDGPRLDGTGLFAIPGLWDMHVHAAKMEPEALATCVAFGITSVRDMGGDLWQIRDWQADIAAGRRTGPRIYTAGPILEDRRWLHTVRNVFQDRLTHRLPFETASEARDLARFLHTVGVDFIKTRNVPNRNALQALMDEAARLRLDVVGHEPEVVDPGVAARMGQRTFEHSAFMSVTLPGNELSPEEHERMIRDVLESGAAVVPTMVVMTNRRFGLEELTQQLDGVLTGDDWRAAYLPPRLAVDWADQIEERKQETGDVDWPKLVDDGFGLVRAFYDAGVPIMAGTDMGALFAFPGITLHEELVAMVNEAELTPTDALAAATTLPAEYFGLSEALGAVAPGYVADLVLLEGNPLEDIANTQRIAAVVQGGVLYDAAARDAMLADIAATYAAEENVTDDEPLPATIARLETVLDGSGAGDSAVDDGTGLDVSPESAARELARYYFVRGDYALALDRLARSNGVATPVDQAEADYLRFECTFDLIEAEAEGFDCARLHDPVDARLAVLTDASSRFDLLDRVVGLASARGEEATLLRYLPMIARIPAHALHEDDRPRLEAKMIEHAIHVEHDEAKAVALRKAQLPDDWESDPAKLNNFAWWCFEKGINFAEAKDVAQRAIDSAANDRSKANAMDTLAELVNADGDPAGALALIEAANALEPHPYFEKQMDRFRALVAER